jgi:hypothetical protein
MSLTYCWQCYWHWNLVDLQCRFIWLLHISQAQEQWAEREIPSNKCSFRGNVYSCTGLVPRPITSGFGGARTALHELCDLDGRPVG